MAKSKNARSSPGLTASNNRSRSVSPRPSTPRPAVAASKKAAVKRDYTSDGVKDNDIFWLPGSDYRVMIFVTVVAAIVRLFRIYQPTSVVFDEVQFVSPRPQDNCY
jgi:dolichyl-phosphate-mannose-protein mannosyltransferase